MKRDKFSLLVHMIPDYLKATIKIPDIQRESGIWSLEQKQNLIDSLYNDFDIPKIYLRKKVNTPSTWWLIDGQQRIVTIKEFLNNEFVLSDSSTIPLDLRGKKFRQLKPNEKEKIISRTLDCIMVECEDEEEEDMFTRLNNGTPLSAAEKRNAITGEVRDSIKKLTKHRFFKYKINFNSNRFACDAVCAQLVLLYFSEGPTDTKGKSLKRLYEEKKVYPERKDVENKIIRILTLIDKIFVNKEPYMKKYNVVSLYLFFQELLDKYAISHITPKQYYAFFTEFETSRVKNSQISEDDDNFNSDLNNYYFSCVNSPDSEQGIKIRHEVLLKKFFSKFINIETKDPNRNFTEAQKAVIYLKNERICQGIKGFQCPNKNKTLSFEEYEFDHIKEHSKGGKTTVENGQTLCTVCHNYKTQVYRSKKTKK